MNKTLLAGAAITDVTPRKPMFLHGYPHVERISEGIHDPLYASALIIDNGEEVTGFCAVDVIFISKEITAGVRKKVQEETGINGENLMVSASHTHSGPVTFSDIFYDPVVPEADPEYISFLTEKIAQVYIEAYKKRKECKIAITIADGTDIGGNRRSKTDAIDPEVPVLVVKDAAKDKLVALSTIYCMHPTVLHEDSKLYSADFPGYTRQYLKDKLGDGAILLYHTGPSGNQSPRHFIESNTFEEAKRLGDELGKRILDRVLLLNDSDFIRWAPIKILKTETDLPRKKFKSVKEAELKAASVKNKLDRMRRENAPAAEIRTTECDWFGALENEQLSRMAESGELEKAYQDVLPAEINIIRIGDAAFVFLPGELFVEYSLEIKKALGQRTFVCSLSNGVLAGYLVTEDAEKEGGYEASNSIFPAKAGEVMVAKVRELSEINENLIKNHRQ